MKILFINACVREQSRTKRLADCLLSKLQGEVEEIRLAETAFPVFDEEFLQKREQLITAGDFEDDLIIAAARRANADYLVTNDKELALHSPVVALDPMTMLAVLENQY